MIVRGEHELSFQVLPGRRSADPFPDVDEPLSVRVVDLEAGVPRSPHRHPHSAEVVYVVAGRGHLWVDGDLRPVAQGDTCLISQGRAHATLPAEGETMRVVCFFPRSDLAGNIEELEGDLNAELDKAIDRDDR